MLEVVLGLIPEAIYFALFMVFAKGTKDMKSRIPLIIILMAVEYVLLMKAFPASIYSRIGFFIMTYIILKMFYKEKAQITDTFTLGIASITLIIFNLIVSPLFPVNYILGVILVRVLMTIFLIVFHSKLNNIQKLYKKLWNRNDKQKHKIKSLTFRGINLVIFNVMFYIINLGILYMLYYNNSK